MKLTVQAICYIHNTLLLCIANLFYLVLQLLSLILFFVLLPIVFLADIISLLIPKNYEG